MLILLSNTILLFFGVYAGIVAITAVIIVVTARIVVALVLCLLALLLRYYSVITASC